MSTLIVLITIHLFGMWPSMISKKTLFPFRLVSYCLSMTYLIIKANIDVATRVLDPDLPINPAIVEYQTKLKSNLAKTIYANSITLTPGTLTVEIDKNKLYVHCLAEIHQKDLYSQRLENLVIKLMREKKR